MRSELETVGIDGSSAAPSAKFFHDFAGTFDTLYDKRRGPFMRWLDEHYRSDMFVRFRLTFEVFGNLQNKTVADIGCGSGPYVIEALKGGAANVAAMDPAPGMLTLLRRRLAVSGNEAQCTILEGAFPQILPPACDHVIVMGVLDYVPDPLVFLTALRQITKISAAVSFPSKHWFRTPFRKFRYWARRCPVYFYEKEQIEDLCRRSHFAGVRIRKIPGAGQDYHVCLSV